MSVTVLALTFALAAPLDDKKADDASKAEVKKMEGTWTFEKIVTAQGESAPDEELKALRLLLHYGASPLALNNYSWTPVAYSATAAAEAYFKQLVAEFEKRRVEGARLEREQQQQRGQRVGGVRLVTQDDNGAAQERAQYRPREDSLSNLQAPPSLEWSPVVERRICCPR